MKYIMALPAMVLLGLSLSTASVQSEALCGPRSNVAAGLANKYSEAPVSIGLAANGTVIEVYASKKGTFTIMMTSPNGRSCLIAAGQNWENVKPKLLGFNS